MFLFFKLFSWAQHHPNDWISRALRQYRASLGDLLGVACFSQLMMGPSRFKWRHGFIPQIAILFFLISWMEELGYMAWVV